MKKMTIQEFDQQYMQINEKVIFFEDYPEGHQLTMILNSYNHSENNDFNIAYMADFSSIMFGEIGRFRIDGVPHGYNAYIFTIEKER